VSDDAELATARWHTLRFMVNSVWWLLTALAPVIAVGPGLYLLPRWALIGVGLWTISCGTVSVANVRAAGSRLVVIYQAEFRRRDGKRQE
jgi:hypothetical protein